jgi:hypothetical protein
MRMWLYLCNRCPYHHGEELVGEGLGPDCSSSVRVAAHSMHWKKEGEEREKREKKRKGKEKEKKKIGKNFKPKKLWGGK